MSFSKGNRDSYGRPRKVVKALPSDTQGDLFAHHKPGRVPYRGIVSSQSEPPSTLHRNAIDISGRKYAKLAVLRDTGKRSSGGDIIWECRCDCGVLVELGGASIRNGGVKSCGLHKLSPDSIAKRSAKLKKPNAVVRREWSHYKTGARSRGIIFSLPFEDFMQMVLADCHYCGASPSRVIKSPYTEETATLNGVDRLNGAVGYTIENCVPSCSRCNIMKHTLGWQEFLDHIYKIVKFQSSLKIKATGGVPFLLEA